MLADQIDIKAAELKLLNIAPTVLYIGYKQKEELLNYCKEFCSKLSEYKGLTVIEVNREDYLNVG